MQFCDAVKESFLVIANQDEDSSFLSENTSILNPIQRNSIKSAND